VSSGVGVGVPVLVDVGMAAAVRDAAAWAVWAMKTLTWFGSVVGKGVLMVGTQARITARIENHSRRFNLRLAILPLPHPNKPGARRRFIQRRLRRMDSTDHLPQCRS